MKSYFPLIEFNIDHDFFDGKRCNDIDMIIARNETRLKNNYNFFLYKQKPWHYVFYIEMTENLHERSRFLERDIMEDNHLLEFLLVARNRNFFSYTQTSETLVGCKLADIQIPFDADRIDPVVVDFNNELTFCQHASLNDYVAKRYPTALACVTLDIADNKDDIISIRIRDMRPLKVTFSFEAKSAYWQYILIPRVEKEFNLSVNETNQQVQFSEIEWANLGNDQKAGFSCSANEIKLSEKYPFVIQLWEKHHNGQSLLVNRLSHPEPSNPANYSHDQQMRNLISIYQYF